MTYPIGSWMTPHHTIGQCPDCQDVALCTLLPLLTRLKMFMVFIGWQWLEMALNNIFFCRNQALKEKLVKLESSRMVELRYMHNPWSHLNQCASVFTPYLMCKQSRWTQWMIFWFICQHQLGWGDVDNYSLAVVKLTERNLWQCFHNLQFILCAGLNPIVDFANILL